MFTLSYFPYTLQFKRPAGTSRGFLRIKMKIGALEYALLAEIRQHFPTLQIRLDANGAYTPAEAPRVLERLIVYLLHIRYHLFG